MSSLVRMKFVFPSLGPGSVHLANHLSFLSENLPRILQIKYTAGLAITWEKLFGTSYVSDRV